MVKVRVLVTDIEEARAEDGSQVQVQESGVKQQPISVVAIKPGAVAERAAAQEAACLTQLDEVKLARLSLRSSFAVTNRR